MKKPFTVIAQIELDGETIRPAAHDAAPIVVELEEHQAEFLIAQGCVQSADAAKTTKAPLSVVAPEKK